MTDAKLTVLCAEHKKLAENTLSLTNAPREEFDALVLTLNEDQCEYCSVRERQQLESGKAIIGAQATRQRGRQVPDAAALTRQKARAELRKDQKTAYAGAVGKIHLRVLVEVFDSAQRVLDSSARTYVHEPHIAKQQFMAIKAALGHNTPVGDGETASHDTYGDE